MSTVDVVIVNYNKTKDTIGCVESLKKSTYPIRTIIIIDNSEKKDFHLENYFNNQLGIKYFKSKRNYGFAAGNNLGIKKALANAPDFILLLNNDTLVKQDFLFKLIEGTKAENAELATGKIYYKDRPDIIWGAGGWIDWKRGFGRLAGINKKDVGQFNNRKQISFISGCVMLISKDVFKKIGFLNETYFMYYEDVEFCLKAKRTGLKLVYVPDAIIWHKVGATKMEKNPFYLYYFTRNSILLVRKFANINQKMCYFFYMFFYMSLKFLVSYAKNKKNIFAFAMGIVDGMRNNDGRKNYVFLEEH